MLSINTNLSSLITQNSLKNSTSILNQAVERMTTGYKINHAKDNAANYSISTSMTTKIGSYNVAADNVAMGMDLVTTASDTVSLMQDKAERLRALCTQARNGTYGAQSLAAINTEANAIVAEINRIYSTAQYNGVSLFTGGTATAEATPEVATFSLRRSAEPENCFITDPISYTDEQVTAMTTMTELVNGITSATNEYSISTKEELIALATYVNAGNATYGKTFVLGSNIDLSSIDNWTPIGNDTNQFKGTFDGNGYVIKNLTIDNETKRFQGLFGYIASGSEIKNTGIEGGSVKGGDFVGGLVGYSNSSISNCYATGDVSGTGYVGGLVGRSSSSYSSISNSYSTSDVTGSSYYTGGLVGDAYYITNSYATGTVSGNKSVGGLAGYACDDITNSYATGDVTGTGDSVGGLLGNGNCDITNSYATGTVSGAGINTGGLVGYGNCDITNSYATGTVSGTDKVGGLVGFSSSSSSISNSYATGAVTGNVNANSITNSADWDGTNFTYNYGVASYSGNTSGSDDETADGSGTGGGTSTGGLSGISAFLLQIGVSGDSSCQIGFDINFTYDLSAVEIDIASDEALDTIDDFIIQLSEHETKLGAVQNRLESALESISVNIENLTSSLSTIRDADIAEVSSQYIQQQILQQAAATLMSTANQSPAIALQLI